MAGDKYRIQLIAAISGQEEAAAAKLNKATALLRQAGHYVFNPIERCAHIPRGDDEKAYWAACMRECMASLACGSIDLVIAVNDIAKSPGAQIEAIASKRFDIPVMSLVTGEISTYTARELSIIGDVWGLFKGQNYGK